MKPHLPVRLFKSVLTCLSAVAVGVTLCSASVTAAETQLNNSPEEEELLLYPAPLTLTSSAVSLAAYTPPSEITIPTGYTEVLVDSVSDITPYSSSATDVAFRLTADVTIVGRSSSLMTSSADSWFFTSDSVDNLASLTFSNATEILFYVYPFEKLKFHGLKSVTFSGNRASASSSNGFGGAIYGGSYNTITLSGNESVEFSGNRTSASSSYACGGAIYGSTITLSGNESVKFSGNRASASSSSGFAYGFGGAIYGSTIELSGNGSVTFSENTASTYGGAIDGSTIDGGTIELSSNESVTFIGNTASGGGAIDGDEDSTIELSGNGSVTFSGNKASSYGGAIYGDEDSTIELRGNGIVTFSENTASFDGGAICGDEDSTIELSGNGSVTFSENTASSYGGAIYGRTIELSGNGSVTFSGNTASSDGGAIDGRTIELSGNGSVTFSENTASSDGGAIDGRDSGGTIELSENGSVTFSGNTASSDGGAIYGYSNCTIELSGNGSVTFSGNTASSSGGAIYGRTIRLSGNESVTFSGNTVSTTRRYSSVAGGAIYGDWGSSIELSGNGSVTFSGNIISSFSSSTSTRGGAIYFADKLSIRNNNSVLFEKNAEISGNAYLLRSIYAKMFGSTTTDNTTVSLSAAAGKSIEFRDSVYIDLDCIEYRDSGYIIYPDYVVELNADYTDESGKKHAQKGDIIFTGAYTASHLKAVKGGVSGTAEEILESRTSCLYGNATLYGGRLRIENSAVYEGCGLTVAANSGATVMLKNATFDHHVGWMSSCCSVSGECYYNADIIFNKDTELSLTGSNSMAGNLKMQRGSTLTFNLSSSNSDKALLNLSGPLTLNGAINLRFLNNGGLTIGKRYKLIVGGARLIDYAEGEWEEPNGWNNVNLILSDSPNVWASHADLVWEGNVLWFTYKGPNPITWTGAERNGKWDEVSSNWIRNDEVALFRKDAQVIFGNKGAGTINMVGTLSPCAVTVNNSSAHNYIWQGSGRLVGSMKLTKQGNGTLTIKTSNSYTGGTAISGGTVVLGANNALGTGAVTLSNATLNMGGKIVSNNLTLSGSSVIQNGTNYRGNFTMNGNLLAGSSINIISGKTANLKKGNVGGTISGAGNTVINGAVTLNGGKITTNKLTISGSGKKLTANASGLVMNKNASDIGLSNGGDLTSAGAITARNITLSNKAVLNAKNSAVRNVTLSGKLQATASTVNMHGNLTAGNLVLNNATLRNNGGSARAVSITNSTTLSNNAKLNIRGYLRSKNLTLNKSSLRQHSSGSGVGLTGTLTMNSGSNLTVHGTLTAANANLSGGTINLTAGSLKPIRVTGTFTLSSVIDLNLNCKLTTGRNYTLIRFNKTNLTSRNNLAKLLGLTGSGATLTLRSTGIILKVTNAAAWNKYLSANKTAFNKAASVVNAITPAAEETEEVEIAANTATTVAAEPAYDRSSADMLVQSNWGMLNASRAFTDTIGNRTSNRRALGEEQKSSVWMSAMGASSRLSSDGVAAGSDYNLFGAAFGMEQQLTEKSSLGLAIGNSRGKVNSFTSGRTKQDTLHTALYGQHLLQQSTSDALTLDWSAAYGRTESKWQGTEWEQKSVQLDARATWAHQLTADTTVSGFAGMQYFASESADIAPGIKSGSVQNLRGEIGVGIGHKATSKTTVYGELSFVGDMVRHNPTAQTEGQRVRGANPGRAGINLSAGVNHALNEKWSVNASYNMELMERANSHSANIGASYKF